MNHGVLMSTCWSQNIYFLYSDFFVIVIVNYTLNICLFICTLLMTVCAKGTHDCSQVTAAPAYYIRPFVGVWISNFGVFGGGYYEAICTALVTVMVRCFFMREIKEDTIGSLHLP